MKKSKKDLKNKSIISKKKNTKNKNQVYIWDEEEKIKNKSKKTKKRKNHSKFVKNLIFFLFFFLILFIPYVKISDVTIENNETYSDETILKSFNYKNHESLFNLFFKKYINLPSNIYKINYNYSIINSSIDIVVYENKPLSHTMSSNYISKRNKIETSNSFYATPLLINFTEKEIKDINKELKTLPYDIILKMKSIKYSNKEEEIINISMYDGNEVYIYINQISDKMVYYNQMRSILDDEKKGPGNIYLYIGNYYEPF